MNLTHGSSDPFPDDIHDQHRAGKAERDIPQGLTLRYSMNEFLMEPISPSPNGRYITAGAPDGTVRLWDPGTGDEVVSLPEHSKPISSVAWSSSGLLASGSRDTMICLWRPEENELLHTLTGHSRTITALAWSPSEILLASGAEDKSVRIWDTQTAEQHYILLGHSQNIRALAWLRDEQILASGDDGGLIRLWDAQMGTPLSTIVAHTNGVRSLAWSPTNPSFLASAGNDATVRVWDIDTGRQIHILEEHTRQVTNIAFSPDGRLLVSQSISSGAEVCFWRTDTWELLASLPINPFNNNFPLAFQTNESTLVTGGDSKDEICAWQVDIDVLLQSRKPTIQYSNAKVVLAGDSGVGKTGLFRVLLGQPFGGTESTHGRSVAILSRKEVPVKTPRDDGERLRERREILLWDLAGQPGYRVIHQLRLDEVTLGLIVFDGRNETDPFASVYYWDRALRQAHDVSRQPLPLKKLLVAARVDRGGIPLNEERISELTQELGFDQYIETSAKDGNNIEVLYEAIEKAIPWDTLPRVTSNELFETIKAFLIEQKLEQKRTGIILMRTPDLYNSLITSSRIGPDSEELRAQFARCIELVESRDLIMRFRFASYILLQPELLDAYSAALVNSVRDEPDGRILESWAKRCQFRMSRDERIQDPEDEKLVLLAMIEDLLRHELALADRTSYGNYLTFPSQLTRENHELPNSEGKTLLFEFEGSTQNIYATLAVRLSRSELFQKKDLWKDAITFTTSSGNLCGLYLEKEGVGEGRGRLTLFFNPETPEETRFLFESYVEQHLQRWAIPKSVHRTRLFTCPEPTCREPILPSTVLKRRQRGFDWLECSNCGTRIDITDDEKQSGNINPQMLEMDAAADRWRNLDVLRSTRREEVDMNKALGNQMSYYDVFFCYSPDDRPAVKQIGDQLLALDMLPWLDEWEVQPGQKWDEVLRAQISSIGAVAVFVGKDGPAPWQDPKTDELLHILAEEHTIIPVLLPGVEQIPQAPDYIKSPWIDMQRLETNPLTSFIERIQAK